MELKALIKIIEALPQDLIVRTGFANPHSWRGVYAELAFEPVEMVSVASMLISAQSAIGKTFIGWKGGDFSMDENTRVHFSYEGGYEDLSGMIFESIITSLIDYKDAIKN